MTYLHCNNCVHEFEGLAQQVAIASSARGIIGWKISSGDAFCGTLCPRCGSELIGPSRWKTTSGDAYSRL